MRSVVLSAAVGPGRCRLMEGVPNRGLRAAVRATGCLRTPLRPLAGCRVATRMMAVTVATHRKVVAEVTRARAVEEAAGLRTPVGVVVTRIRRVERPVAAPVPRAVALEAEPESPVAGVEADPLHLRAEEGRLHATT